MATRATLAGVELLAEDAVGWHHTQGVEPFQRVFVLERGAAARVLAASANNAEVELRVERDDGTPLVVKALSVLSSAPARATYLLGLLVADRRWRWTRALVVRRYNVRRRTGEKRQTDQGGAFIDIERLNPVDDVTYAKFSLKDELTAWTAKEVIEDVLVHVTGGAVSFADVDLATLKALPVEGLELEDDGQIAVQRALALVPGLACFVDADGTTRLTLRGGGAEDALLTGLPVVGPPLFEAVDLRRLRPSRVVVYFTPEDEVRFDFQDGGTPTTVSIDEPRILENVLPSPDPFLTVKKLGKDLRIVQGTWLPINQALLDAWNNDTANPATIAFRGKTVTLPKVTFNTGAGAINRLWFSPGGYHGYFEVALQADPVWARRWSALMAHYRQTFRVSRRWIDRVRSLKAERIAIVDPETGTRAPADVFANYALIPTARRIAKSGGDFTTQLAYNITNFNRAAKLADSKVANTATVQVLDADVGILRVSFNPDAWGGTLKMVPSAVTSKRTGKPLPTCDPRDLLGGFRLMDLQLKETHDLAVVLTVAAASPNSLAQLFPVVVEPDAAKKALPTAVAARVGTCEGPEWHVRVGAGIMTARFAWLDDAGAVNEVEQAILEGGARTTRRLVDEKMLTAFATAVAASVYAGMANYVQGEHHVVLDVGALPVGRILDVGHELARSGRALTKLHMPPDLRSPDPFSLVPESVRRVILKLVQP